MPAKPSNFTMPQSLSRVLLYTVFSTKNRAPLLRDPNFRSQLHSYLGACAKTLDCLPIRINGTEDHVHLLTTLSRTVAIAEFIKEIKRNTTIWAKSKSGQSDFTWQAGYGCFSVSESQLSVVSNYINNQEEHHRKITFQDEYRELLRLHGEKWDEQYVWD
ncbi:MAG: transposase [Luteolibacter sp.]